MFLRSRTNSRCSSRIALLFRKGISIPGWSFFLVLPCCEILRYDGDCFSRPRMIGFPFRECLFILTDGTASLMNFLIDIIPESLILLYAMTSRIRRFDRWNHVMVFLRLQKQVYCSTRFSQGSIAFLHISRYFIPHSLFLRTLGMRNWWSTVSRRLHTCNCQKNKRFSGIFFMSVKTPLIDPLKKWKNKNTFIPFLRIKL